jgi:protein-S-isoprenylcysteine O-methyltransferase Ste14
MGKLAGLVYGVACYAIGMVAILYSIAFVGGFAPRSVDAGGPASTVGTAVVINLVLLGVFAVQHSGMARTPFKAWLTRLVPRSVERSTYVLFSALALGLLFCQWRPIAGTVWHVDNAILAGLLTFVFWLGWGIVFLTTFLIDHFDLFGLKQVWSAWQGKETVPPTFKTPLFYRFVRHPLYVGFILALWSTAHMSASHLFFAAAATGYIFVGMWLEERDLLAHFGDTYRRYRERVSMIVPMPPKGG